MARKTIKGLDIRHIPFRLLLRLILIFVTVVSSILVGWMLWQIFFSPIELDVTITNQRAELLQPPAVLEIEIYQKNGTSSPFPSSVFPTSDNIPLSDQ